MRITDYDFNGKCAIVRVDFNVPIDENGVVTDTTRIEAAMPTVHYILEHGGRVVLMSHLGKPKGRYEKKYSLVQILGVLDRILGKEVRFASDCGAAGSIVGEMRDGDVVLLENLRFYAEEEGKPIGIEKGDVGYEDAKKEMKRKQREFAGVLASYADCYVNDAFGTAHRCHASTAVIADFFDRDSKMLGFLMEKEVDAVEHVLNNIKRPFVAIMGGAKVSTKIGIIENLMDKVDSLILCGGMTYTFYRSMGKSVGKSICEEDKLDVARGVLAQAKEKGVNLLLGTDCVVSDRFAEDGEIRVVSCDAIPDGWMGMDAGPESVKAFAGVIEKAKTILWNGPAGVFEMERFTGGSRGIAEAIAKATEKGAYSLIGGGDSVACINKFKMANKVSYISTGGGALLEAIEGKDLPGVVAINQK